MPNNEYIRYYLDTNESSKIKGCKLAEEIWEKLREIYKGGNNIKEQKKSLSVAKYELFKMKSYERTDNKYYRYSYIIKDSKPLGKEYSLDEKSKIKILNALLKEWETKATTIEKANNLNSMPIESFLYCWLLVS